MKIGLSLSGGGVRAASQLGIAKALHEAGIYPEVFSGTSGGSIVAALLANGISPEEALEHFKKTNNIFDFAIWHITKGIMTKSEIQGIIKGKKLERILCQIFDDGNIFSLRHPIGIVTTDLISGKQIVFTNNMPGVTAKYIPDYTWEYSGEIKDIVRASCGFPGVFIPKKLGGYVLVDGGLTNNVPSDIASALGADKVITIGLSRPSYEEKFELNGLYSILNRSFDIIYQKDEDSNIETRGIYLQPNLDGIGIFDSSKIDECFDIGYTYGKKSIDGVRKQL